MPIRLRKRLDCHYCGKRSSLKKSQARKFKCEHCLAVNFLDENGDIADVPPEEHETPKQYAQTVRLERPSIFCSTCLKNQHLYTTSLSNFLPDLEDSDYPQWEAALANHKKNLEERYPQCCAQCEPKVRAQLHKATKTAKDDYLLKMLLRTRERRIASPWGWRRLLVKGAGLGYAASLAIQLLWHGFGSQAHGTSDSFQLSTCFTKPTEECVKVPQRYMGISLAVGLSCVWWNPKWQYRLQNGEGRLVGLNKYYQMQFGLLVVRFVAWLLLLDLPMSERLKPMLHSVFLVIMIILAGWSYTRIKIDDSPRVNWQQEQAPLLAPNQFVPPPPPPPLLETQVSINAFAPAAGPVLDSWQAPVPPPAAEDAMDWTPSQTFQPQPKQPRMKPPTPFHGTLPALRGGFKPRVEKEAIGIPPGHFDHREALPSQSSSVPYMAEPKFFPSNVNADTGLENIFGQVFSLQDHSVELKTQETGTLRQPTPSSPVSRLNVVVLFAAAVLCSILDELVSVPNVKTCLISLASIFPISRLVFARSSILSAVYLVETLILLALTAHRFSAQQVGRIWDKLGTAAICFLLGHELLLLSEGNASPTPATPAAPSLPEPASPSVDRADFIRRDSIESSTSDDSVTTTSTAPAWKTPSREYGGFDFNRGRGTGFGMGGLALDDGMRSGRPAQRPLGRR